MQRRPRTAVAVIARVRTSLVVGTLSALLFLVACADDGGGTDEIEVGAEDEGGKADAAGELRLRTGDTTVWVTQALERRSTEAGRAFVLRGRASRNVTGGLGFVADDPYGDFAAKTARTWEVTWSEDSVRMLADGTNQFVRLDFVRSGGRPDSLTVRAQVRPRLTSVTGSSKIYVTAELTPVVVGGETFYRLKGKTTARPQGVTASSGTRTVIATPGSGNEFTIDVTPDQLFAKEPLVITAQLDGRVVAKTLGLGLSIKRLGLTAGDPYAQWPAPSCTTARASCLRGLGDAALDTAPCGDAIEVLSCASTVGVRVDDEAFQQVSSAAFTRTGGAAMRADYAGLVGAERVEEMQGGLEQTITYRLEQQFGRWYLGAAARGAALARVVDQGILDVYARPFDVVESGADPSDLRAVAADALLVHLAEHDFESTALARSYEALVAEQRATHVASLAGFRTTSELSSSATGGTYVTGTWLGLHSEVLVVDGAATSVLVEVD